jgi:hypothetical protein
MTKIATAFIFIFLLGLMCACSKAEEVSSPPKDIRPIDNYVVVQGRWKKTTKTNYHKLSRINSTYITCDKKSMTCKENTAVLVTPEDEPDFKIRSLYIVDINYRTINWSNDIVNAKYEGPVADFEIRISLRDKFAERSFRETKARGSETANPNIYEHWVLE